MKYVRHSYGRRRHRKHGYRHHSIPRAIAGGVIYSKCEVRQVYKIESQSGSLGPEQSRWAHSLAIKWQQPEDLTLNAFGFNGVGSRFFNEYKNWEQYAITGVKLQFIPAEQGATKIYGAVGTSQLGWISLTNIMYYDDPNADNPVNLLDADFIQRKSTRFKDPGNRFTHYIDLRAYSAQQNVPWQDCKNYNSQFNSLSKGQTNLRLTGHCPQQAEPGIALHGYFIFTWYIKFRG